MCSPSCAFVSMLYIRLAVVPKGQFIITICFHCVCAAQTNENVSAYPHSMDGFRVVKLSEVIRQMDVVITCTGTVPHAVASITSALIITGFPANKCTPHLNIPV